MTPDDQTGKAEFFRQRNFFEKLCDARTLLNRKNYASDSPLLENAAVSDFAKIKDILDDLQDNGIVADWIIGGGTAVMFYSEVIPTIDVDVFARYSAPSILAPLQDVYAYLTGKYDATAVGGMLRIGGLYLQFLPADSGNPVDAAAVRHPHIVKGGLRLFELEYLICSMLHVGARKYLPRLALIKTENRYDGKKLAGLLRQFGLELAWQRI